MIPYSIANYLTWWLLLGPFIVHFSEQHGLLRGKACLLLGNVYGHMTGLRPGSNQTDG